MHEVGFILLDRDAKLGSHGPKIHPVERFCVMKSETPQDKRLVGFGDCTVAAAGVLAWSSAFDVIVNLLGRQNADS